MALPLLLGIAVLIQYVRSVAVTRLREFVSVSDACGANLKTGKQIGSDRIWRCKSASDADTSLHCVVSFLHAALRLGHCRNLTNNLTLAAFISRRARWDAGSAMYWMRLTIHRQQQQLVIVAAAAIHRRQHAPRSFSVLSFVSLSGCEVG